MIEVINIKLYIISFLKKWFGPFTKQELKRYLFLGVIFGFIIGTYWTIRPLKDALFGTIVGKGSLLALAKIVSMLILFPVVIFYGKMVERFSRINMFYIMGCVYAVALILWSLFFALPAVGLSNSVASPLRISGWLWYVFVESFGSLMVALFWAFTTDISDSKSSRYGFPVIVLIGQVGGMIFPKFLSKIPIWLGTTSAPIVGICSVFLVGVMLLIMLFARVIPKSEWEDSGTEVKVGKKIEKTGFLGGLKLLLSNKYLLGIFFVLAAFEIVAAFIDFNFKNMVIGAFTSDVQRNIYLSNWGSAVNTVSFLCLLFGINNIQRWIGIRFSLALVPFIIGIFISFFYLYPQLDTLFWLVVGAKGLHYAFNGPTLKQLYVPTTTGVKYKAQSWIETFGSRSAKASSSVVNLGKDALSSNLYLLILTCISFGIIGVWVFVALFLGKRYNKAIEEAKPVC